MNFDRSTLRAVSRASAALIACALPVLAHAADGPSFDCARATSAINRMICASPDLSVLDRTLADHYRALLAQPGIDVAALQRDEARWLREVRNTCPDAACLTQAYEAWDAVLQARGRRAAIMVSAGDAPAIATPPVVAEARRPDAPVAKPRTVDPDRPPVQVPAGPTTSAETRPFAVDPALLADARGLRGKPCASGEDVPRDVGYVPVPGSLPVIGNGSVVLARRRLDADFAFLLDTRRGACRMVDVVALPPAAQVSHLLQCVVPADDGTSTPRSVGVGLRRPGQKVPLAYWEVDVVHGQLIRQPLGVLNWGDAVRCQDPQVGD